MGDIELVIKIDKEDFRIMKHNIAVNNPLCPLSQEEVVSKIASGIPLPKGHDRLIDAKAYEQDIHKHYFDNELVIRSTEIALSNAPTIIEADTESEE